MPLSFETQNFRREATEMCCTSFASIIVTMFIPRCRLLNVSFVSALGKQPAVGGSLDVTRGLIF